MKACKKLMSMLLLMAMCLSFMAAPAFAAYDESIIVGRVTADMMGEEPAVEPAPAPASGGDTVIQAAGTDLTAQPSQMTIRATIGDMPYESLAKALSAAASGDVITVKADASFSSTLVIDKKVTIVNYGHTITVSVPGTSLGISGSGATIRGGAVVINASTVSVREGEPQPVYQAGISGVALDDVNVYYSGPSSMLGSVTVYGGSYSSDPGSHVAPGYEAVQNGEGRYVVQKAAPVEEPAVIEETPAEETPAEETPAEETPAEETPAEETPAEETPAEETPAEETPAEETPAEETPAEETPAEETSLEANPAEEIPAEETPAEEDKTLLEQINDFIFGSTDEDDADVDEEAKTIEHNSDKIDSAGNTVVTVSGAPDEATLQVADLGSSVELEEKISEQVEGEVTIVKALDIHVEGELDAAVEVTLESPSFVGLAESPSLWHVVGDAAEPVSITSFDAVNGVIKFMASSFSPYVITVPDVTNPATKNDDAELSVELAPDAHVSDGNLQKRVSKATTDRLTLILDNDTSFDLTNWGTVAKLEINCNNHRLKGHVDIPAGKTLTLTGTSSYSGMWSSATVLGSLILVGTGSIGGNVVLYGGNLYIDGSNFSVVGTIDAKGKSFVEISSGTYGNIKAEATCGGHVTGGTYKNAVPASILAKGYSSKKDGDRYIVYMSVEARVKTVNGAINFSRNGGNYVEFYKGDTNASQNYSFQFAVTPVDGLIDITIEDPSGATTTLTSEYTYDTGNGRVVISKNSVSSLLNSMPAGRAYIQFTFDNGALIEVPLNIYPNVTFEPTTYYIDSFEPVVFTMTDAPSYITVDLKDGENPYYKVLKSSNYTISGNKLTLSSSYLNNLEPGAHNFDFWYDMSFGKTVRLRCTVLVYADYKIVQINNVEMYKDKNMADVNWYQYSGKNLNFTANGDPSKFVGVKVDGKMIGAGNYAVSKDTANHLTNVGLYPGYLATLAQGKHTISVVFSDGEATATFNILSASASPKTGDTNNALLWAAILALSGAAVIALIPKKKKQ